MEQNKITRAKELGSLLLDVGVSLLSSGASCSRIRITMKRLATTYNHEAHISIAPKSISLTLNDDDDNALFNGMRSTPSQ
ncbi:MAG TPA: threonine/serine exporter family protein, partial [Chitinophagaceae bacterium]|nr:threonine/serine exporter family protein [Chitinophagaceae bacterium]